MDRSSIYGLICLVVVSSVGAVMRLGHVKNSPALPCLAFAALLLVAGCAAPSVTTLSSRGLTGGDLPSCPGAYNEDTWSDCYGTVTSNNGNTYVGEWRDDKMHGQGTMTWPNGNEYVGEWSRNRPHGQGTYTFSDIGNVAEGRWTNGCLKDFCVPTDKKTARKSGDDTDDAEAKKVGKILGNIFFMIRRGTGF